MEELVTVELYKHAQFSERVGLKMRYNLDTFHYLRDKIPFPRYMYDAEKKLWSIDASPETINDACELLDNLGYDTSIVRTYTKSFSKNQQNKSNCWVKKKRTRLYLHWPYIRDEGLRNKVRLTVRSVSGWKFHADDKCWSIPIAQASTLYSMLADFYEPLAEAIRTDKSVKEEINDSITRVEMSGAIELDGNDLADIDSRLTGKFPEGLDLYPFQKVAVAFAEASKGRCLIGDEMGIGKTISAMGYAAINPRDRPALVVCPSNVKFNWKKELNKWLPSETVHVVTPSSDIRAGDVKNIAKEKGAKESDLKTRQTAEKFLESRGIFADKYIPDANFIIINYDMMMKYNKSLTNKMFKLVILDESHYIKNVGTKNSLVQRTAATMTIAKACPKTIALSGTAISSRPKEFFNTLNLMRPSQFGSHWDFVNRYCDPYNDGFGWNFDGASNIKELNERTRDLCIRRLKSEVLPELPPKTRTFFPIELDKKERSPYDYAQEEWDRRIDSYYLNGQSPPKGTMLTMLNDLRHICGQIKVDYAADWIKQYREQTGKPIVVFAHHREVVERLAKKVNGKIISGATDSKTRQELVDDFQAGKIGVLVCNTIAAKEGITLTKADTVLFIEREWTPTDEEQAEDRIYRIGQESQHVHAVYLSCVGTIDEHFDRVVEEKRKVVKAVLDGGNVQQRKGLVSQLVKKLTEERGWRFK